MKKLILTLGCCALLAGGAFGQTTQSIKVTTSGGSNTSGSFSPGSAFSLDTSATFTGFTGVGLSYWLQVPAALAPFITITSEQYFTWTDPNQTGTNTTFTNATNANSGYLLENRDLGATSTNDPNDPSIFLQAQSPGTYLVSTLNFTLSASAPAGTYTLLSTTLGGKASAIGDSAFGSHSVGAAAYNITVVPEPSAFVLAGLGLTGLLCFARRRTVARS